MGMKLVFQGGERPQHPLQEGNWSIGSGGDTDISLAKDGIEAFHCELLVGAQGIRLRVPSGARVLVNDRPVDGLLALRENDVLGLERSFRFDYSEDGQDRHIGRIVLLGDRLVGFSGPSRAAQAVVRSFPMQ